MTTKVLYRYNGNSVNSELYSGDFESKSVPPLPPVVDNMLQEDGFFILQEDTFRILMEA